MGPKKDPDESSGSSGGSSGGNTVLNARVFGAIEKFDPETDKWQRYEARLQQYFVANDVEDSKKKSILLTCVGKSVSDLLWDLCVPDQPDDARFSYKNLCDILKNYFVPQTSEIVERFKFYQRRQKPEESIAEFMKSLRHLAKDCAFGTFLNSALRDIFIVGLSDQRIQSRLLSESALDVDKAMQIALSMENAAEQTRQIRQPDVATAVVHSVGYKGKEKSKTCGRCGRPGHPPDACFYKNAE